MLIIMATIMVICFFGSYIAMFFILKTKWTRDIDPLERGGMLLCAPFYLALIAAAFVAAKVRSCCR